MVLVRFASAEEAQRNSEWPEQGAWWAEMEKLFVDEPSFADYDDVILVRGGGSDEAGFVQVMVGRTADPDRAQQLTQDFAEVGVDFRPDILGGVSRCLRRGVATDQRDPVPRSDRAVALHGPLIRGS